MSIPIAMRLATRQWLARPLRPILCSLAIAAAVALIICIGAAMDSLRFSLSTAIGQMLGVAEVHVRPAQRETDARLAETVLERVRGLPEVEFADGRVQTHAALKEGDDRLWFDAIGIDVALDEKLRPKTYASRLHPASTALADNEVVVDTNISELLKLHVGDQIPFSVDGNKTRQVVIAGIINRPAIELIAKPTMYVPAGAMFKDMGIGREYSVIDIKLRDSADISDYDQYAKDLGKVLGPSVDVSPGTTSKAKLTEITRSINLLLLILSIMSAICAALIIGTTLSVGVQERVRQFGQLRCIGASRRQLASFLLGDAAVMLVIGETLGLIVGIALSAALVKWFPQFFLAYRISSTSLAISVLCGGCATLLGAAIPIWQVARVSPMAAITAVAQRASEKHVRRAAMIGVALLLIQVLMWNLLPTRETRFYSYVILGIPMIFAGWSLMAPAVLIFAEPWGAKVLGLIFAVRPTLLRSAWSSTPWRAGAMIAGLMIGVTLRTTVGARGESVLASWVTPAHIPDLIIKTFGVPFGDRRLEMLRKKYPELTNFGLFEYFSVKLTTSVFKVGPVLSGEGTTFIAVDPANFTKFVELEYMQGDPATAVRQLQDGKHIFISKEFHNVRGLNVGDTLDMIGSDGKPVGFTVAAVVTSTGVELVKNYFDLRGSFSEKSISSVLGSIEDGRKYFRMGEPTLALVNVRADYSQPGPMSKLRDRLSRDDGLQTVSSVELKTSIFNIIKRIIDSLSVVALGALCVASLGVANMVIASIHAKRYEFGVLRAIGAGRGQLIRLVLAEVSLVGVIAGMLGAAAGLHFAYMATQVDWLLIGYPTNFLAVDPYHALASAGWYFVEAVIITTLLAGLASLAPAIRGALTAQRALLASGRG